MAKAGAEADDAEDESDEDESDEETKVMKVLAAGLVYEDVALIVDDTALEELEGLALAEAEVE